MEEAAGGGGTSPIGTTPMETRVLKEPRGFMRCLQFIFAIFAFATCCHFSNSFGYDITCIKTPQIKTRVIHNYSYPFRLDHEKPFIFQCENETRSPNVTLYPPGDFKSDAELFVFTGVFSMLASIACLVVYVFFSEFYSSEDKKAPMIDFCATVIIAVFWLSASSSWANGLTGIKNISSGEWIFKRETHPCLLSKENTYVNNYIKSCEVIGSITSSYAGANISVVLGFLNFFLWTSHLWFLYKETSWFASRSGATQLEG